PSVFPLIPYREKNGLKQLTSTQPFTTDPRFTCRPSSDRMAWYRGTQSRTFHGKTCIRWDDDGVPTKFPLESFSNVSSPSVDYMTLKVFSTSLSQHENHCRNPDNHRFGPWCFYKDGDKIDRAPCFYTCVTDIKKLCLAKALFPYYQTPYNLDDAPVAPVDPHLLRNIKDDTLKMKNAFYDLMDVLDVPEVLDSIGEDDSLTFAEDSVPTTGYKKYRDYERIRLLAGRQGVDKPWKPCFTACEDNPITCWPNQTSTNPTKRLLYFGHKVTTREQRLCVKWTEAFSVLYKHNAEHQRKVEEAKKQKKKKRESRVIHIREHDEKLIPIPEADLGHLYTPLVITIVAGIICILLTFYDQILAVTGLFSRIR
ncbi:hypothetical protein GCK32_011116, partial [Trichostrongylus colubriformis]